jgi:hypothetical protein
MIVATNKQQKEHRRGNKDRKEERKQNRHTKIDNKTMRASKSSPLTRLYTKWFRRLQTLKFQTVISLY